MRTDRADVPGDEPADAFASLAHETRLDVVRALGDPDVPGRMPRLSFSRLQDRVGVRNSSKFNYHLSELTGHYVERTPEGYVLTYPGLLVWIAMRRGVFADPGAISVDPFALEAPCQECGGTLAARYEGGGIEVACGDCGAFLLRRPLPPATAAEASQEHLLDVAGRTLLNELSLRREGLCPVCNRRAAPRVVPADDRPDLRDTRDLRWLVVHDCDHCAICSFNTVGEYALSDPAVRAFLREHGVETDRPWALPFAASDDRAAVRSRDPLAVAVPVAAGGHERVAVVDGALNVEFGADQSTGS